MRWVLEMDLPPNWNHYDAWLHHAPVAPAEVAPNHWRWELTDMPAIDLTDVPMAPSPPCLGRAHGGSLLCPAAADRATSAGRRSATGTTRWPRTARKRRRRLPPSPAK